MKILFVTTDTAELGGSEWLWTSAAQELLDEKHNISAFQLWHKANPVFDALRASGLREYFQVKPTRWYWRLLRKFDRRSSYTRILDQARPDLVVLNQLLQTTLTDWAEQLTSRKIPYVTLCQLVLDAPSINDTVADQMSATWLNARSACFVSQRCLELCEVQIGRRIPHGKIVFNPVRIPQDFTPGFPCASPLRMAIAARLDPDHKGQDTLFEALALPSWRNRDFILNVYGDGGSRHRLARLVTMLELDSKVRFHGHVHDVRKLWAENHVCVMPSRQEGLPIAMVEAMLAERAVVGTDVAGIPEVVEDNISGFIAAACTRDALDQALQRMWASRSRLEEMGRAARVRARSLIPADPGRDFVDLLLQTPASA